MELDQEIYNVFIQEFEELLQILNTEIINASNQKSVQVNEIFRVFHTLKGNASTLELKRLQKLSKAYCEYFRPKQKKTKISPRELSALKVCTNALSRFLSATKHGKKGKRIRIASLINRL